LRRMARGYTVDFYKRVIDRIRSKIPDAAITSDIIVGFPGETEQEFMNSINLIEELQFDAVNTAAYSPRPHTPASDWEGQLSASEKFERLRFINSVVSAVAHKINKGYVGRRQEILVEGRSDRHPERFMGRTRTNKIVNFDGDVSMIGQLVDVEIITANPWALRGKL